MEPEKPEDFVFGEVALGPKAPIVAEVRTRATHLTKMAIQSYLNEFFRDDGQYRYQIQRLAPYSVQFETGITGTARDEDPTLYEMQIARLWQGIRTKLPCILIVDASYTPNSTGLGGVVEGLDFGRFQGISMRVDATLGITLEIAANDQTVASDIRDVLCLIFGQLTHFNRSHYLEPEEEGASWVVRLPLTFEVGGLDRRQIQGDNLDIYWSTSLTLNVDFEGVATLPMEHPDNILKDSLSTDVTFDPFFENEEDVSPSVSLDIFVPETVRFGVRTPIRAYSVPFGSKFKSDNMNILYVQDNVLIPVKMGECHVLLLDNLNNLIRAYPVTITG